MQLITLTNDGYIDYTHNLQTSLKNIGIEDMKIFCIGDRSYNFFKSSNNKTEKLSNNLLSRKNEFQNWRTKNFNKLMYKKLQIIHSSLLSHEQILYVDGDVVFLKNNLEELKKMQDYDLVGQLDFNPNSNVKTLCAGFMLINSNQNTQDFFDPKKVPKDLLDRRFYFDDQKYINKNLDKLNYNFLNINEYPNGAFYYRHYEKLNPTIIHFNYVIGEEKKEKMKKMGHWYI